MPSPPALHLRIFLPFALGYFLSYLYRTVNAVLAPDLVRELGIAPASLGLLTAGYFLMFAAAQLPLGLLLDRFGPRRVEASLLFIAAGGALVFARAETLGGLLAGRALIGLGVSACLMAAFKAFAQWFPAEKLPLANGIQMVSGGLGALVATVPVEFALQVTDWRGVFLTLAVVTASAAFIILVVVPEKGPAGGGTLNEQMRGTMQVFSSRLFWGIAPWAVASQASFQALIGLWAGPWLRDVAGLERGAVANTLMGVAAAMVAGYFGFGAAAERLGRRGVPVARVATAGMGLFLLVQVALLAPPSPLDVPLWLLFGLFGTSGILPYAALTQRFPAPLAGRVNTSLNLLVFAAAFGVQWLFGAVVGMWPETAAGGYDPAGYRWGLGLLVIVQLAGCGWYRLGAGRGGREPAEAAPCRR